MQTKWGILFITVAFELGLAPATFLDAQDILRSVITSDSRERFEVTSETVQILRLEGLEPRRSQVKQVMTIIRSSAGRERDGSLWITFRPERLQVEIRQGDGEALRFDSRRAETEPEDRRAFADEPPASGSETEAMTGWLQAIANASWRVRIDEDGEVLEAEPPDLNASDLEPEIREQLEYQLEPRFLTQQAQRELQPFPLRPLRARDRFAYSREWRLAGFDRLVMTEEGRYEGEVPRGVASLPASKLHRLTLSYRNPSLQSDAPADRASLLKYSAVRVRRGDGELWFDAQQKLVVEERRLLELVAEVKIELPERELLGEVEWTLKEERRWLRDE